MSVADKYCWTAPTGDTCLVGGVVKKVFVFLTRPGRLGEGEILRFVYAPLFGVTATQKNIHESIYVYVYVYSRKVCGREH